DEEFVWERSIGETFSLGNHHWRILNITHNDVLVEAGNPAHAILPFWRAETLDRSFHFQEKLAVFLEQNQNRLSKPDFLNNLTEDYKVDRPTAETLITFLKAQKEATNRDLPHRHHLVIEHFMDALNRDDRKQVIVHTLWGGRVNRPYSLALRAAWRKQFGYKLPVVADDNAVLIILPHDFSAEELLRLVSPDEIEDLLKLDLESSGHFGARFRENAGRALLLPPPGFNKRQPLWFNRMRAGKLMEAVQSTGDFPVLLETWRNCLHDDFELERLKDLLNEIHNGRITVSECATRSASPFAANLIWEETNYYMYRDDTPEGERKSSLDSGLLADVIFQNNRQLRVSMAALNDFMARRQRTAPGYAPADALECVEWIKERGLLPFTEWRQLWQAIQRDHPDAEVRIDDPLIQNSLCAIHPEHAIQPLVMAIQDLSAFADTCRYDLETLSPIALRHPDEEHTSACVNTVKLIALAQSVPPPLTSESVAALFTRVLRFYGPVAPEFTRELLGVPAHSADTALEQLLEERTILSGPLLEGDERTRICDADNLEYLLRLTRRHARAEHHLDPRPLRELPLFLATYQDFPDLKNSTDSNATASDVEFTHHSEPQELRRHIQKLMGYPAPVELWEQEILPARFSTYRTHMLDSILEEGEILWLGCGPKQVLFCFEADLEMFQPGGSSRTDSTVRPGSDINPKKESRELPDLNKEAAQLFDHPRARYRFSDLLQFTHLAPQELNARLWELSWAGLIVADGMAALRQGIRNRFRKESNEGSRSSLRGRRSSRTGAHPGLWRRLEPTTLEDASSDALDQEELNRDRLRVLLERYGILFRELLMRELPHMRWKQLFRSLRLMEFSGEVFGGYYFEDIPGLQYISARAFRILRGGLKADSIYWMNACDPIFPGGMPGLRFCGQTPRRIATNHVVYHGSQ
ncbi:MAG: hypothetical protein KDK34_01700, partial [Leptospiraceae bacterium]|nr:hypothetical protein [Leptospiraceae bacterium]